jgi:hypothetical protein
MTAMFHHLWTRKQFALSIAVVTLGIVAAIVAAGLAYPEPFTHTALGPEWQCSKLAFVFTTCSRVGQAGAVSIRASRAQACPPRRT